MNTPDEEGEEWKQAPTEEPKLSPEEITRRLRSKGFEEDELKVLAPTEEKLRELYAETLKQQVIDNEGEKGSGNWDEDDAPLSKDERRSLVELRAEKERHAKWKEARKKAIQEAKEVAARPDEFGPPAAPQGSSQESAPLVTPEEMKAEAATLSDALREGMQALEDDK
jgi:hypothetical protein